MISAAGLASTPYYPIGMGLSNSIVLLAATSSRTLKATAAKVICYAVVPFLFIAAFEFLVLNAARLVVNASNYLEHRISARERPLEGRTHTRYSCTEAEKNIIREIIVTVRDKWPHQLWLMEDDLERLGKNLDPVHPLKFLAAIIADPSMKEQLRSIFKNLLPFKKDGFMRGLNRTLPKELEYGTLYTHVSAFAKEVHVREEMVRPYLDKRDWEGLVRSLL